MLTCGDAPRTPSGYGASGDCQGALSAVLQLIPDPKAALTEMGRALRPGGRLAVMVPTAGPAARLWRNLPIAGAHAFGEDELGDILEDHGFTRVRITNFGSIQWVRGKR